MVIELRERAILVLRSLILALLGLGALAGEVRAELRFEGLAAPAMVSRGQTFAATVSVRNTAAESVTVSGSVLTFTGSGLSATAQAGNPTALAADGSALFGFTVSVASNASLGIQTATFAIAARGAVSQADWSKSGIVSLQLLSDAGEDGLANFTAEGGWATSMERSVSGAAFNDSPGGDYLANQDVSLTSRAIPLGGMSSVLLAYDQSYDFENNFDHGYVELSRDGESFTAVTESVSGQQTEFVRTEHLISGLTGVSSIRIRFRLTSDSIVERNGWVIDNIKVSAGGTDHVTVQTPALLTIGTVQMRSLASQGQSFVVTVPVGNTGQAAAIVSSGWLGFSGGSVGTYPMGGNPTVVPGRSLVFFKFLAWSESGASTGPQTATFGLIASDANTGADVSRTEVLSRQVTIQTPASLVLGQFQAPATLSRGQSRTCTLAVTNQGQAAAAVRGTELYFEGPGVYAIAEADNPSTLAGGATGTFHVRVSADSSAATGPQTALLAVTALDANSGQDAGKTQSLPSVFTVVPAMLEVGQLQMPTSVYGGQSLTATVALTNVSAEAIVLDRAALTFSGSGLTATPMTGNPASLQPGASGSLRFAVTADLAAAYGYREATFVIEARGASSGADAGQTRVHPGPIWIAAGSEAYFDYLDAPGFVSQGQIFPATVAIFCSGQEALEVTTTALVYAGTGVVATPLQSNPTRVEPFTSAAFRYSVHVAADASTGVRTASLALAAVGAFGRQPTGWVQPATRAVFLDAAENGLRNWQGDPPWTTSTQKSVSGAAFHLGACEDLTTRCLTSYPLRVGRPTSVVLTYAESYSLDTGNFGYVELSRDGGPFLPLAAGVTGSSSAFQTKTIPLSGLTEGMTIQIRFRFSPGVVPGASSAWDIDDILLSPPGGAHLTVQAAAISVIGALQAPLEVSRGQSFVAMVPVSNPGEAALSVTTGTLTFSSPGLTVTPLTGNPTAIAGATSATFRHRVSVATDAETGPVTASFILSATDGNDAVIDASRERVFSPQPTVETAASLALGALQAPATALQGQSFEATVEVTNTGQADLLITGITLTFTGAGLSAEPVPGTPSNLSGGASGLLRFRVLAGAGAAIGLHAATLVVAATDANSGSSVGAVRSFSQAVTLASAALLVGTLKGPVTAYQGQSVVVTVSVTNSGVETVQLEPPSLTFGGFGLTAALSSATPIALSPSATIDCSFHVALGESAEPGSHPATFTLAARGAVSGSDLGATQVLSPPLLVRQTARASFAALMTQARASQGWTFPVTVVVTNAGEEDATIVSTELVFSGADLMSFAFQDNPTRLSASSSASLCFYARAASTASCGVRTAVVDITLLGDTSGVSTSSRLPAFELLFVDAAETGLANFTPQGAWATTAERAASGFAFHDSPGGPYPENLNVSLTSRAVPLNGAGSVVVSYIQAYDLESGFDYGFAELARDAGGFAPLGQPVTGLQSRFSRTEAEVSGLTGSSSLQLRFRLATDAVGGGDGWYFDDLMVYSPRPATVQVETAAALSCGSWQGPEHVSRGQTFTGSVVVTNTGQAAATITTSRLEFRPYYLPATALAGNPTSVAGGASGTFRFQVVTGADTDADDYTPTFIATFKDANGLGGDFHYQELSPQTTVQIPPMLGIGWWRQPVEVSQGQSLTATVGLGNAGQAAATLTTVTLQFSTPGVRAAWLAAIPASLVGGGMEVLPFRVTVGATVPTGFATATMAVTARDANSLADASVTVNVPWAICVLPAPLEFGALRLAEAVPQGQSCIATVSVTNAGGADVTLSSAALAFSGEGVVAAPAPLSKTILEPGASLELAFLVTVDGRATPGVRQATLEVTADEGGRDVSKTEQLAPSLVVEPSGLVLGLVQSITLVSQGQTFAATVSIDNVGAEAATIAEAALAFAGVGIVATPLPGNPASIGPGGSASFRFQLVVPVEAATGVFHPQVTIRARGATSGRDLTLTQAVSAADGIAQVTVQSRAAIAVGSFCGPAFVSQGQSFVATFALSNPGQAALSALRSELSFSDQGLTVTTMAGPPPTLPGGSTVTCRYGVAVAPDAPAGVRLPRFSAAGADANSGAALNRIVSLSPAVTVQTTAVAQIESLAVPWQAFVGQSFTATATVTNTGEGPLLLTTAALDLSAAGLHSECRTPLPLRLPGRTAAQLRFQVQVLSPEPPFVPSALLTVGARDEDRGVDASVTRRFWIDLSLNTLARLSVTRIVCRPAVVSQGQEAARIEVELCNPTPVGCGATAIDLTCNLQFAKQGFTVTPADRNASRLAAGATARLTFAVDVDSDAPSGLVTVTAAVSARDLHADQAVPVEGEPSALWRVQRTARLRSVGLQAPESVSDGRSFVATVSVANDGEATATVTRASLSFDVSAVSVTALDSMPAAMAGGVTTSFAFRVDVRSEAAPGPRTATLTLVAHDANSNRDCSVTQLTTDAVRVTPAVFSVQIPLWCGLNFLSLPMRPVTTTGRPYDEEDLIRDTGASLVAALRSEGTAASRFIPYLHGFGSPGALEAGKGYVVVIPRPAPAWSWTGTRWPVAALSLELRAPLALVGYPRGISPGETARTLLDLTSAEFIARTTGTPTGRGVLEPFIPGMTDPFLVQPGAAYLVPLRASRTIHLPQAP